MKIIYFATYYSDYLKNFYVNRTHLAQASYQEQLKALMDDFFGVFGAYTHHANLLGAEAHLIIANAKPLQQAWAKENNVPFDETNWEFTIPIAQTKQLQPDIFFIGSMFQYYGEFLDTIKQYTKKIYGWISCPIPEGKEPKQLSLVLTSLPSYVDRFRAAGHQAELLPAAFDTAVLDALQKDVPAQDILLSFAGGFYGDIHAKRTKIINHLFKHTPLEVFSDNLYELALPPIPYFQQKLINYTKSSRLHPAVWGLQMYRTLQRSQITVNVHGDIAGEYAVNMRMYEATGVGTLLLTDGKQSKYKLFEDHEVVYYDSPEDAVEKALYYLQHDAERQQIAQAGQQKTVSMYNFSTNVALMLSHFEKY
ncbi:MAG: glycosyltransferase family protein, partial [Thermoflexibacteraceae bacterium]